MDSSTTRGSCATRQQSILIKECLQSLLEKDEDSDDDKEPCRQSKQVELSSKVDFSFIEPENVNKTNLETDSYLALAKFPSYLFAAILEEVLQKINILEECKTSMRIRKIKQEMPELLAYKYGIDVEESQQEQQRSELKCLHNHNLDCYAHKLNKMVNDRETFAKVIKDTYICLALQRGFRSLWDYLKEINEKADREYMLEIDESNNRTVARALRKQMRLQRNQQKSAEYEINEVLEKHHLEIGDAETTEGIKYRYVNRWQDARTQQHQLTMKLKEDEHIKSTEYYKKKAEQETYVHQDVEMINNVIYHETLRKIEIAIEKYETDSEAIDLKIQIKRTEYLEALEKRKFLEEKYKNHQKEIRNWIDFKTQREIQQKYDTAAENAAITVQAWWRGLTVRLKLEPFKKAKRRMSGVRRKKQKEKKA